MTFEIIFQDPYFIAINKPNGILVHRSTLCYEPEEYILQLLRDQVQQHLYPVHRLDRATSGVLLFAFDKETARQLSQQLISKDIQKEYIALIRGWLTEEITHDQPVKNDRGNLKDAITRFVPRSYFILDEMLEPYPQQRYSLVQCFPQTGRWHQIRQHLAQLRHYIINDRVHGNNKHNKLFKEQLSLEPMFLHAQSISLSHPKTKDKLLLTAKPPKHFEIFERLSNLLKSHTVTSSDYTNF